MRLGLCVIALFIFVSCGKNDDEFIELPIRVLAPPPERSQESALFANCDLEGLWMRIAGPDMNQPQFINLGLVSFSDADSSPITIQKTVTVKAGGPRSFEVMGLYPTVCGNTARKIILGGKTVDRVGKDTLVDVDPIQLSPQLFDITTGAFGVTQPFGMKAIQLTGFAGVTNIRIKAVQTNVVYPSGTVSSPSVPIKIGPLVPFMDYLLEVINGGGTYCGQFRVDQPGPALAIAQSVSSIGSGTCF